MQIISKLNYLRISPRKVRLVADLIRRDKAEHAERILDFTVKKAAKPIAKLLKTAIADARNNFHLNSDNLYISRIIVNEGPKYKRWRPRSRGMANQIKKRSSHIILILEETKTKEEIKAVKGKKLVPAKRAKKEISSVKKVGKERKTMVSKEQVSTETLLDKERENLKIRQPKQHPEKDLSKPKPKSMGGLKRIFRRKAF